MEIPEETLEEAREAVRLVTFPNTPLGAEQEAAFERAVRLHAACLLRREIPPEVSDFRVGHFQVKLREGAGGARISPAARAVLLRAGLLYRGVERGM